MHTQTMSRADFRITEPIKREIVRIVDERIRENYVTREDFSELKTIVRDIGIEVKELAEAQKELSSAQKELSLAQKELAEAQKRTEIKVEELTVAQKELAEAQKRTEIEIEKMAFEIRGLAKGLKDTRVELGGLQKSVSYGFENEAYRMLPALLKERYGIEIEKRLVRAKIRGKEINIFGRGRMDGKEIMLVGEVQLRLDEIRKKDKEGIFADLEEKVELVKGEYQADVVRLLIAHFATTGFITEAEKKGIIVVQTFEW
ncbi:MAG: hypothetical protein AB1422_01160 [bacterium]